MANARDVYNVDANKAGLSDPQNRQFDLSFPYLSQSHVSVTVNGTATTAFTYATSTRIQLNTGPTAGDVVVIKRATSPNTRLVDYQTGSVLSDEILDRDSLQAFYLAQEANDVADIVLSKNASNLFDAGNERITNVANPTGAQDVATKNYLENTWLSSSDKTQLNALNTTNLNTVAGAVSNVNTVAGAITNVNTVAGQSTQIGLLGTSDAVNDMNVLGTAGIVQDLNLLGTTTNVAAMAELGTSTNVTNMATLGASGVVGNIATVAGVASTMSAAATNATNAASSASAASGSASAAANSAAAAATALDSFDDRYLGSKSSEPSVDNDGNALVSGALFFDNSVGSMKVFDGGNWILATSAGAASLLDYEYTATAGQTTFTGADNNSATLSYSAGNLIVTLNGIVLDNGSDYTATSGTSIVLASGAALNDHLAVVAFKSFTVADTVPASTGGTFGGNVTVSGTVNGRNLATDGTKLDGIAAGATNYVHPTGAGNNHIPSGGATGQSLIYASAGTAAWGSAGAPFAGTVATLTASGTLTNNQKGYQILINGSGVMVTLPSSTIGMYYVISNAGNAAFQILGTSNQPVGGANSPKKIEIGGSVIVAATGNGTGWTITGVNSDGGVLATTYDVTAGSYTHNVAPNTACLLVCAWGATASSATWFKNYVYTVGGTGGGNYAEKFITSPASSYAVVIGGASNPGGSANDTTVAGMTLAGGPPKPGGGHNNSANGPVFPPAAMPTGGDYAARGGNGSLYSGSITGGGGGSASRGGTGGNAGTILQGTAGTCWSFGGGGTGGNDAPTAQYTGSFSTQGAAYTTRNANAYNLTNLGVINEVGSGGIVATASQSANNAGKGASSLATLTLGGSQTVNIVIGSASAGRGGAGAFTSGHQYGADAGCVTFVEFTEAV